MTECNATSLKIKEPVEARWRYPFIFIQAMHSIFKYTCKIWNPTFLLAQIKKLHCHTVTYFRGWYNVFFPTETFTTISQNFCLRNFNNESEGQAEIFHLQGWEHRSLPQTLQHTCGLQIQHRPLLSVFQQAETLCSHTSLIVRRWLCSVVLSRTRVCHRNK